MKTVSRNKSRMKKLQGKLRQKAKGGNYYYRLTIANGIRKEFALKTADETEAIQRAEELDSIYAAPNMEVAVAQLQHFQVKRIISIPVFTQCIENFTQPDNFTVMG